MIGAVQRGGQSDASVFPAFLRHFVCSNNIWCTKFEQIARELRDASVPNIRTIVKTRWLYEALMVEDILAAVTNAAPETTAIMKNHGGILAKMVFFDMAFRPLVRVSYAVQRVQTPLFGGITMLAYLLQCYDVNTFDDYIFEDQRVGVTRDVARKFANVALKAVEWRIANLLSVGPIVAIAYLLSVVKERDFLSQPTKLAAFRRVQQQVQALTRSTWAKRIMIRCCERDGITTVVDEESIAAAWTELMKQNPVRVTSIMPASIAALPQKNILALLIFTILRHGACSEAPCESTFSITGQITNLNMSEERLGEKAFLRVNNRRRPREEADGADVGDWKMQLLRAMPQEATKAVEEEALGTHTASVFRLAFEEEMRLAERALAGERTQRKPLCDVCRKPAEACAGAKNNGATRECSTHDCANFISEVCHINNGGDSISYAAGVFKCSVCKEPAVVPLH